MLDAQIQGRKPILPTPLRGGFCNLGEDQLSVASYFVRSGYVYLPFGSLRRAGGNGYYWSTAADSAPDAYNLDFDATNAAPSYNRTRYFGFPIRCVAL